MPHQEDPILEMLHIYDDILESLLEIKDYQIIVATGLSQSLTIKQLSIIG